MPPGAYRPEGALDGFPPAEKTATVSLDATATVDMVLQLAAAEQVVVSGESPLIDTTSTTTGTSYTSSVIAQLPVDRNYADIALANPGVDTDRGDTEGRALALTIYGATSAENQWIIDGVNTTNVYKGTQGKVINSEFVQEVEVKTGGYQAEYGRALGGIINVVTKSGGNVYHGDGFVYYDSTGTTAARASSSRETSVIAQMRVVDGQRVDYGFDLGGFLVKDRLWIFGAYDRVGLQGHVSRVADATHVSTSDRVPDRHDEQPLFRKADLERGALDDHRRHGVRRSDDQLGCGGRRPQPEPGRVSSRTLPSAWNLRRGTPPGIRVGPTLASRQLNSSARRRSRRCRALFHQDRNSLTAPDGIRYIDRTCDSGTPDNPCPFPYEPNSDDRWVRLHLWPRGPQRLEPRSIRGDATLYGGNHEIKAGGDYQDGRTETRGSITGGQLVFIQNEFGGRPYYLARICAVSFDDPTPVPYIYRRAEVRDFGVYLQDSWRAAPGLTINAGLRWDGEDTSNYRGETVLQFRDEWQPRLGVVWDPWRDGATKIYAFAGRFSYGLPTGMAINVFSNFTVLYSFNYDPVSVVPDPNVPGHDGRTSSRSEAAPRETPWMPA